MNLTGWDRKGFYQASRQPKTSTPTRLFGSRLPLKCKKFMEMSQATGRQGLEAKPEHCGRPAQLPPTAKPLWRGRCLIAKPSCAPRLSGPNRLILLSALLQCDPHLLYSHLFKIFLTFRWEVFGIRAESDPWVGFPSGWDVCPTDKDRANNPSPGKAPLLWGCRRSNPGTCDESPLKAKRCEGVRHGFRKT